MTSFRDCIKNYYTFTAIKRILSWIEDRDIMIEIIRYSTILDHVPAIDYSIIEDIDNYITIPYPSMYDERASAILYEMGTITPTVFLAYEEACAQAERSIVGYRDIISRFCIRKNYLIKLQKLYGIQSNNTKVYTPARHRFDITAVP